MSLPKEMLIEGARILEAVLQSKGFRFRLGDEGKGSGGQFAWGEFVRGDRRLELHFRHSLGLVRYHVGEQSATHESYMQELGLGDRRQYPGFAGAPLAGFHHLAHDLTLAEDFTSGTAAVLQRAAAKELVMERKRDQELMAGYVRDKQKLEELKTRFRAGQYADVIEIVRQLRYPDRMTQSERNMVDLARRKSRK